MRACTCACLCGVCYVYLARYARIVVGADRPVQVVGAGTAAIVRIVSIDHANRSGVGTRDRADPALGRSISGR